MPHSLLAQGQFITELSLSSANFTDAEDTLWQHFSLMPTTQSAKLVSVGSIANWTGSDTIRIFSIPGGDQNLQARGQFVRRETSGTSVWWGAFSNANGYVGVSENTAGRLVFIQRDTADYFMYPLSDRYNILVKTKRDTANFPDCEPPVTESPANITPGGDDPCETDNECKATVSCLVLVTPEATAYLGGLSSNWFYTALYVHMGLNTINFALWNSGVYGKSVRFIVEPYDFAFTGSKDITIDIDSVLRKDTLAGIRRSVNQADIMIVLSGNRYNGAPAAVTGWFGTPFFMGIVSINYLHGPRYSFAHELGHCFGANHDRGNPPDTLPWCPYGYIFEDQDEIERRTVMASYSHQLQLEDKVRVLHFSNPEIEYNGGVTGTYSDFNARYISHKMCGAIQHLFDQDELKVKVDGPDYICDPTTYTVDIDAPGSGVPGVGPYRYAWYFSTSPHWSPQNPGSFLGSTASVTLNPPATGGPIWIFVFVSSSDGVLVTDRYKVDVCEGAPPAEDDVLTTTLDPASNPLFVFSPNPVKDELLIRWKADGGSFPLVYHIFNAYGQQVDVGALTADSVQVLRLNKQLPNGCYWLSVATASRTSVQTFILHR